MNTKCEWTEMFDFCDRQFLRQAQHRSSATLGANCLTIFMLAKFSWWNLYSSFNLDLLWESGPIN